MPLQRLGRSYFAFKTIIYRLNLFKVDIYENLAIATIFRITYL
jgi:hypothetical protein